MEKVIYSNKGGLGIILDDDDKEEDFFMSKDFIINDTTLSPGDMTTLFGMFVSEVRYCGALKDDPSIMVFHLGTQETLFSKQSYYSCFYFIHNHMIVNKYAEGTARNYLYINGAWK